MFLQTLVNPKLLIFPTHEGNRADIRTQLGVGTMADKAGTGRWHCLIALDPPFELLPGASA